MNPREKILVAMYEAGRDPTHPDPSLNALGAAIGTNRQTAHYHVKLLVASGLVKIEGDGRSLTPAGVRAAKKLR